ncbi:hypothetical protein V8G54_009842 [Vigna mungo]|uniref:Uncharacterized protein n=1 Tax=Vigna mungo TaxID=3915 RepID=A0AAQ3NVA3_VIGMU
MFMYFEKKTTEVIKKIIFSPMFAAGIVSTSHVSVQNCIFSLVSDYRASMIAYHSITPLLAPTLFLQELLAALMFRYKIAFLTGKRLQGLCNRLPSHHTPTCSNLAGTVSSSHGLVQNCIFSLVSDYRASAGTVSSSHGLVQNCIFSLVSDYRASAGTVSSSHGLVQNFIFSLVSDYRTTVIAYHSITHLLASTLLLWND